MKQVIIKETHEEAGCGVSRANAAELDLLIQGMPKEQFIIHTLNVLGGVDH